MAVKFGSGGKGFWGRAPQPTPAQVAVRESDRQTQERSAARRLRTRQSIVVGSALIEMAERGDPDAARLRERILAGLTREQDLKVFGMVPKRPKPS